MNAHDWGPWTRGPRSPDEHPDAPLGLWCRYRYAEARELACELLPRARPAGLRVAAAMFSQAALQFGGVPISYSRDRSWYRRGEHGDLTYHNVRNAVRAGVGSGILETLKPPHSDTGFQSVLRGTSTLLSRISAEGETGHAKPLVLQGFRDVCSANMVWAPSGGRPPEWVVSPGNVLVSRRGGSGPVVGLGGGSRMRTMERRVRRLNDYLCQTDAWLTVPTSPDGFVWFGHEYGAQRVSLWSRFVHASFVARRRDRWRFGGRLYGPWWQSIPRWARLGFRPDGTVAKTRQPGDVCLLRIDGEDTVEPDFRCLHPGLLYAAVGRSLEGDAYEVAGVERGTAKIALNALINASSVQTAVRVLSDSRPCALGLPQREAVRIVETLLSRHAPIRELLGRDAGVALQRIDAGMALDICLGLFDEAIPVLPVHDSFVCRLRDVGRVEEVMHDTLDRVLAECRRSGLGADL